MTFNKMKKEKQRQMEVYLRDHDQRIRELEREKKRIDNIIAERITRKSMLERRLANTESTVRNLTQGIE